MPINDIEQPAEIILRLSYFLLKLNKTSHSLSCYLPNLSSLPIRY